MIILKKTLIFFLLFLFFSCKNDKPNIILIIADDMSPIEGVITPKMDKIASKELNLLMHIRSMLIAHLPDKVLLLD